jgi:hypothetical protein
VIDTNASKELNQTESGKSVSATSPANPPGPLGQMNSTPDSDRGAIVFVWGVWALLLLAALAYVRLYASKYPIYGDEWNYVPYMTGNEPVTVSSLWALHGEHRLPLPKLIWLEVLKLTHYEDFRVGLYLNVVVQAGLAFTMILTAKKLRGWLSYSDAFFPVALMSFVQFSNYMASWSFTNLFPALLAVILFMIIVRHRAQLSFPTAALAGVCLVCLPLSGSSGLAYVPALAIWLCYTGFRSWFSGKPHGRRNGLVMGAFLVLALVVVFLHFRDYPESDPNVTRPGVWDTLKTSAAFLSVALGTSAATDWWPYLQMGLLALFAASGAVLAVVLLRRPSERYRALGLLLFMGGFCSLALGLGWGRGGDDPLAGAQDRYVIMASPALVFVYCVWALYGPRLIGRVVQMCLFTLMCVTFSPNFNLALEYGRNSRQAIQAFERDLFARASPTVLAERHFNALAPGQVKTPEDSENFVPLLRMLQDAGIGEFRFMRRDTAGAVTSADAETILGWAWDPRQSGDPVQVDVYADSQLLATVLADQFRQDLLNRRMGDGRHGFGLTTPDSLKDGKAHLIGIKVSGTDDTLAEGVLLAPAPGHDKAGDNFAGSIDGVDDQQIGGWAWDSQRPNTPLTVDIYVDDTKLAAVSADQFRPDLRDANIGDGKHGFALPSPAALKDGKAHAVRVKIAGTGITIVEKGVLLPKNSGAAARQELPYEELVKRIQEVVRTQLPPDTTVLVVSKGDDDLLKFEGRTGWHFPRDKDGAYAGNVADSAAAVAQLEALRAKGGQYLLLPEPAFWWLEHYKEFQRHLDGRYTRVYGDEHCIIYRLSAPGEKKP